MVLDEDPVRKTSALTCRLGYSAVLIIAAALLLAPALTGHVDDLDAQLHRVIVKNMLAHHDWLDLSIVAGFGEQFRDHLPFGFWPAAATAAVLGPSNMELIEVLFCLITVAVVMFAGRVYGGNGAGLAAGLILSLTEAFWHWGGRVMIDPLLWLLSTASGAILLNRTVSCQRWVMAGFLAALAASAKGPFGLAPFACAAAASAFVDRSFLRLLIGAFVTILAAVPVAAFLLVDSLCLHLGWFNGYVLDQLFASAVGIRKDGANGGFFYPFHITLVRFWPGLPLLVPATFRAIRPGNDASLEETRSLRVAWLWCLLLLAVLCIPSRKWGSHTVLAFPALSLLGGLGAAPWLRFWPRKYPSAMRLSGALTALSFVLVGASALGLGRFVQRPPCEIATTFGRWLRQLPVGSDVLVASNRFDPAFFASLVDETQVSPWPASTLDLEKRSYAAILLRVDEIHEPQGWTEKARDRGWALLFPTGSADASARP